MTISQIVLLTLFLALIAIYVRKFYMTRLVTQYNAASVNTKLKAKEHIVLLDVRTSRERSARRIDGSIHIPLQELRNRMGELEKYRSKEIICYCASGNRSLSAAVIIRKQGFRAANLTGGMSDWMFDR
jgi:rhodanese-related sulfurtransferase